ncbi:MAG: adenylate/guanylate cyclase domain-containing protein [Cyanobacteria bacterium P01_E01_bin.6]
MKRFAISIRLKVFGIAGSMLALLLGVAYVNHRNISLVNNELIDLAHYLTKLTEDVALINVHVLEQEIHFERVVRGLETDPVDHVLVDEELAQFEERGVLVDEQLEQAIALAEHAIHNAAKPEDVIEFARIQPLLEVMEGMHQNFHDQGMQIVELMQDGDKEKAEILDQQLEKFEDDFDHHLQSILFELGDFTKAAALAAEAHEKEALRVSWILAAIAAAIGLTFASLVTVGLVRPIRRLVNGTQELEQGNLQVQVPIASRDEVGILSKSFNAMVSEIQGKEQLKATFGQYVDPRIVEQLINHPSEAIASQRQDMTVFFSDMVGFSSISELLTPTGLVTLINQYLTLASEPILANNGVIDKFIGDAVTAFWGPPFVSETDHAKLACYAALEQLSQLAKLRRLLPEILGIRKGLPNIQIRIGLATGELVAGNIGSEQSKSYTVLGRPVQIAEYLEGASKRYGTTILLTAATRHAAADAIETRELDRLLLPGSTEPTTIYELLDTVGNLTEQQEELRDRFEEALANYWNQRWDEAQKHFERYLAIATHDTPSRIYLERIDYFRHHPPGMDWNGTWEVNRQMVRI